MVVTARDITIETVAHGGDEKDHDCGVALPLERLPALDALPVIDRHQDERRNHQNADERDLVRGGHWRDVQYAHCSPKTNRATVSPVTVAGSV